MSRFVELETTYLNEKMAVNVDHVIAIWPRDGKVKSSITILGRVNDVALAEDYEVVKEKLSDSRCDRSPTRKVWLHRLLFPNTKGDSDGVPQG